MVDSWLNHAAEMPKRVCFTRRKNEPATSLYIVITGHNYAVENAAHVGTLLQNVVLLSEDNNKRTLIASCTQVWMR